MIFKPVPWDVVMAFALAWPKAMKNWTDLKKRSGSKKACENLSLADFGLLSLAAPEDCMY